MTWATAAELARLQRPAALRREGLLETDAPGQHDHGGQHVEHDELVPCEEAEHHGAECWCDDGDDDEHRHDERHRPGHRRPDEAVPDDRDREDAAAGRTDAPGEAGEQQQSERRGHHGQSGADDVEVMPARRSGRLPKRSASGPISSWPLASPTK
jgi:hypothetical protein